MGASELYICSASGFHSKGFIIVNERCENPAGTEPKSANFTQPHLYLQRKMLM
jgi:hypothetical protein